MTFSLNEVTQDDMKLLSLLHEWVVLEPQREMFTCRPVHPPQSRHHYVETVQNRIKDRTHRVFVLVPAGSPDGPYGKVTAFDYNPRNRSAEFGYYLPPHLRGRGYGKVMVELFLRAMFNDGEWPLHKLYATTASGNVPSVKLLSRLGFRLDGKIREHYWFDAEIQDQLHFSLLRREFLSIREEQR